MVVSLALFNAICCSHLVFFMGNCFVEEYVPVLGVLNMTVAKCIYFVMLTTIIRKLRLVKSMDTLIAWWLLINC